jgi:hypothetical protein
MFSKQAHLKVTFFLMLLILFSALAAAEIDPNKEYRVALVIGNSSYIYLQR